jgi:DNA primase
MNVRVAKLPKGCDPADTITKEGTESWKKIVDSAQHIVHVYVAILMEHPLSDLVRARAVRDKILPYVAVMPSAIERAYFIREIHKATGIPEAALAEDIARIVTPASAPPVVAKTPPVVGVQRTVRIEERLLAIVFWQKSIPEPSINPSDLQRRLEAIIGEERITAFEESGVDKINEKIFEVEILYEDPKRLPKEVEELLGNLEQEFLTKKLEDVMIELGNAERTGNTEIVQELLTKTKDITSRLNTIKNSRYSSQ